MKEIVWVNGDKMHIETGHKGFDAQTNIISHGNINANTMHGRFIRPADELECNGRVNAPRHLQDFDLHWFNESVPIPAWVERDVRRLVDEHGGGILYAFYHYYQPRMYYPRHWRKQTVERYLPWRRYVHGFVLTDEKHKHLETYVMHGQYKSYGIVETCRDYVSE